MKSEDTIYDNEKTQYEDAQSQSENVNETAQECAAESEEKTLEKSEDKKSFFRRAATGMGMGILMGSAASFVTSSALAGEDAPGKEPVTNENANSNDADPVWAADDEIPVATSVNDEMSFSQAFAAARAEVGSGGAFEWRGNVYNTFTAEEWNSMSQAERDEYGSHFTWSRESNDTASTTQTAEENTAQAADDNAAQAASQEPANEATQTASAEELLAEPDPEVEILGVVHDDESGFDYGTMTVDGQDVYLVDVDNDGIGGEFDYLVVDANNNGSLENEEFVDISDGHISVTEFSNYASPDGSLLASNDEIDYTNDDYDLA